MKFLRLFGLLPLVLAAVAACADEKAAATDKMCFTVSEAMSMQTTGISPKRASILVGNTFQFTITNNTPIPGIAPKVVSRNLAVVTVDSLTGLATGVGNGSTFVVASTFNGTCVRPDSAKVTVSGAAQGNAAAGLIAYQASCRSCHMNDQARDLKIFAYSDSNIYRRAIPHVTHQQAVDIIAHVRSLGTAGPLAESTVLYQPGSPALVVPGSTVAQRDSNFAVLLFGADEWRTSITRDSLLAQNIKNVRIPITLPVWSDELTRYDWMPGQGGLIDGPIPAGVLARPIIQNRYNSWRNTPTMTNAVNLATSMINESHDESIPDAPCLYDTSNWITKFDSANAQRCFDVAKHASGFCYLAGTQLNISSDSIIKRCEPVWWETGHMAHKAQQRGRNIELRSLQITSWIYLGSLFSFAAGTNGTAEASLYFTGPAGHGVSGLGYGRWASWMAASMMVRRPGTTKGATEACRDALEVAEVGHSAWIQNIVSFVLDELNYRLDNGTQFVGSKDTCTNSSPNTSGSSAGVLGSMMTEVNARCGVGCFNSLKPKADSVRARINALQ